ncbi:MAG: oligosaccharide flippase family protein [bacterium]|nr:oligosaccharide flippase family protein [bacterium]
MPTKNIAVSTLWQLVSQVTMAALSILTVKFVAVGLSKELAGNYNSAYGFLQLFGILADFGLYAVSVREVSAARSTQEKEDVLGALIVIRCCILILSLCSALLFVWCMPAWKGTPLPLGVTIASLVPFFTLLAGIIRTVFQVQYKMHYVFIAEVTQRIFTVVAIGSVIVMGVRNTSDLHVYHLFLLYGGIGAFILFCISLLYGSRLMHIRPSFNPVTLRRILRAATPYGVAFFCVALYRQFDITLIALLRDDYEIQNAYYGFVVRMTDVGFLIPTFLLNSTLPTLSERDSNGEDTRTLLGKTFLILLVLGTTSALFSALWARPLIALLTTDAYLSTAAGPGSDTAMRLMSAPLFLNALVLYGFYVLLTKHKWRQLVCTLLVGAILSLSLNIWLIPLYGFVGAASVSIFVHCVLAILLLPQSLKVMPISLTRIQIQQWLTYSLLLAAGLWLLLPLLNSEVFTVIGLVIITLWMGVAILLTKLHKSVV